MSGDVVPGVVSVGAGSATTPHPPASMPVTVASTCSLPKSGWRTSGGFPGHRMTRAIAVASLRAAAAPTKARLTVLSGSRISRWACEPRCAGTSPEPLEDGAGGEGAAAAHRDEPELPVGALQLVEGGRDQAAACAPDRVAEGDRPAVDVDLVPVGLVQLTPREHHRREGLVDLEQVDVVHGHAGFLKDTRSLPPATAVEVVVGIVADQAPGRRCAPRLEPLGVGPLLAHPEHGGRAVGDLRGRCRRCGCRRGVPA